MSRDANGNYTLPAGNPVISGTTIDTGWANPTMSDLGTEITNSLSRTGKGGMLVPFRVPDGSVSSPSLSFTQEPTSGLYRATSADLRMAITAVDTMRWVAAGAEAWDFNAVAWVNIPESLESISASVTINAGNISDNTDAIGVNAAAIAAQRCKIVVITADQTYNPPVGVNSIKVTIVAGGGGGGGVIAGLTRAGAAPGGGGGGAVVATIFNPDPSYAVVIGDGGVGGLPVNFDDGKAGDQSSFIGGAVNMIALGGLGGAWVQSASGNTVWQGSDGGGGSGGDYVVNGGDSDPTTVVSANQAAAGNSGGSLLAGGRRRIMSNGTNGQTGHLYGGGGSGGYAVATAIDSTGGAGANGVCIIEEFF